MDGIVLNAQMFRNDLNIFSSNEKQKKLKPKWQQNIQREDKCTKRKAGRIMKAIVWCCAIVIEIDITVQYQPIKQRLENVSKPASSHNYIFGDEE